ncbi:MAG: hypothetical protein GXO57_01485 [Thermodesulfobacteria bacterium]|nr:hypothetical protein [Thermodesulfobacteriota bacterium]
MSVKEIFAPKYLLPFILWILLSIRFYPGYIEKTIIESGKMFLGSGLYGLGMTLIFNGLSSKIWKKALSRENFIKMVLWLAVITSLSASLDHYFLKK